MASSRIRLHRVQGTHYECARTIGTLTRDAIRQRFVDDLDYMSPLLTFITTEYGLQLHHDFIQTIRLHYPWYWDEICGLADGSELPLEQILVLNFLNETKTACGLIQEKAKSSTGTESTMNETGEKGCTTVLLNRQDTNTFALLHNEDHAIALFNTGYLIEADIEPSEYDDGKRVSPREKFIAYCYAGNIPGKYHTILQTASFIVLFRIGNGFGANQHGFAFGLNGLYPNYVAHGRLPRQIINRALLSVRNEVDLDHLIRTSPVAFGFCINGAFFRHENSLLNYEIGPNLKVDNENYISKCRVLNDGQKENKLDGNTPSLIRLTVKATVFFCRSLDECKTVLNYLVHYNHYERLNRLIVEQSSLESTRSRGKRGEELGEIFTVDDAMNLLGDQKDQSFPIFRIPSKTDVDTATLCTAHFDFHSLKLFVFEENPKANDRPALIYNLIDLFA